MAEGLLWLRGRCAELVSEALLRVRARCALRLAEALVRLRALRVAEALVRLCGRCAELVSEGLQRWRARCAMCLTKSGIRCWLSSYIMRRNGFVLPREHFLRSPRNTAQTSWEVRGLLWGGQCSGAIAGVWWV